MTLQHDRTLPELPMHVMMRQPSERPAGALTMKYETNPTYSGRGLGLFRPTSDGAQPFDEPTRTPRLLLRARDDHSAGEIGRASCRERVL